jgi:thiamine transport system substrate-binding protein
MNRRSVVARSAAVVVTLAIVAASAPAMARSVAGPKDVTITLVAHDSYNVSKSVIRAFTRETGIDVKVLRGGDAGSTLNQAILTKDHPLGDVLYGVDNAFLSRALKQGIFEPYESPELAFVPTGFHADAEHRVTPIDRSDVCINYDKQWFAEHAVPVPQSLKDLTDPAYRDLVVVENPATSSTGLIFLLATASLFDGNGDSFRNYWTLLRENGVKVVKGWEQAWYGEFTASSEDGERPIVVSYASSPVATIDEATGVARAGTMLDSCFEQIEYAGVLKGTEHRGAAQQFIDFMLSPEFQGEVAPQMYVYPVRTGIALPPEFVAHADVPLRSRSLPFAEIGSTRNRWIREWTDIVLR